VVGGTVVVVLVVVVGEVVVEVESTDTGVVGSVLSPLELQAARPVRTRHAIVRRFIVEILPTVLTPSRWVATGFGWKRRPMVPVRFENNRDERATFRNARWSFTAVVGDVKVDEMSGFGRDPALSAEQRSFDAVYQDRYVPLVRLARMMVGSVAVAEELTQEAFVRLLGAWERVETPEAFVHTTLVNLCRTHLGRVGRADAYVPDRRPVIALTELDETWNALGRIPAKYRVVLALRFYEDLPEAEVARILGLRLGTVKAQTHRGLACLRKELSS